LRPKYHLWQPPPGSTSYAQTRKTDRDRQTLLTQPVMLNSKFSHNFSVALDYRIISCYTIRNDAL